MFCAKCGARIEEGNKFCEMCGFMQSLSVKNQDISFDDIEVPRSPSEKNGKRKRPRKKKGKARYVFLGLLMLIVISTVGWMVLDGHKTRTFNDAMERGNRYLLNQDFEQAKVAFLEARDIRPRNAEPYIQLAEVYLAQDDLDSAWAILQEGHKAVRMSDGQGRIMGFISSLPDYIPDVITDVFASDRPSQEEILRDYQLEIADELLFAGRMPYVWVVYPDHTSPDIAYDRRWQNVSNIDDDFLPVENNGVWELQTTAGQIVIGPNVFDEIRPVIDGHAWVKWDGSWGVITLVEIEIVIELMAMGADSWSSENNQAIVDTLERFRFGLSTMDIDMILDSINPTEARMIRTVANLFGAAVGALTGFGADGQMIFDVIHLIFNLDPSWLGMDDDVTFLTELTLEVLDIHYNENETTAVAVIVTNFNNGAPVIEEIDMIKVLDGWYIDVTF